MRYSTLPPSMGVTKNKKKIIVDTIEAVQVQDLARRPDVGHVYLGEPLPVSRGRCCDVILTADPITNKQINK